MATSPKSQAICVLGMHRSGTSLITRAVNLLGADVGHANKLLPPHQTNPTGFWEHSEIVQIHNQILKTLNRSWDTTKPLPHKWWLSPQIQPMKKKLKELVKQNYAGKPLWVWKDPRTCLLLPLWKQILNEMGTELKCILVVRNPLDVAVSLKKRDNFSPNKSFKMWTLNTLNSFLWSKNTKRALIHYDHFLNDWEKTLERMANQLNLPWPKESKPLAQGITRLINPDLRHSSSNLEDLATKGKASSLLIRAYRLCLITDQHPDRLNSPWITKNVRHLYVDYAQGKPVVLNHQYHRYRKKAKL
ncbi:sulfotransferase family protein [Salinithrix halophila]|uniref:Sulfotransferase family protein n=1 Tax=Salinithrix halophila TaxID=1485204 RepID=A0ABV8JGN7_9BACL